MRRVSHLMVELLWIRFKAFDFHDNLLFFPIININNPPSIHKHQLKNNKNRWSIKIRKVYEELCTQKETLKS